MAVRHVESVTLEVPDIAPGVDFYTAAGMIAQIDGDRAYLRCPLQDRPSLVLLGGAPRKRLHHVCLGADDLDGVRARVAGAGGLVVDQPHDMDAGGLWLRDPNGMLLHLVAPAAIRMPTEPARPFEVNGPGRTLRVRRSAILPLGQYPAVHPLRLGHVLVFSPDVEKSVAFASEALGMGLADRSQDIIAFMCGRRHSDHHVMAFAKSPGVGFHHASFQVNDPDEVGRAGRSLADVAGRGDWGFGRHTIGSNFFHYVQDPWGSWFEYYSDMDFVDDYDLWTPTDYALEDSLASWGPRVPDDFVHNYELDRELA